MKAVAYLRRSTSKQALSIERQRKAVEDFANREGCTVVAWFVEEPMSGSTPIDKRPALCAAMDAVEEHRAGALLVDERSRLARDVYMAGAIGYELRRSGCVIMSADGVGNGEGEGALIQRTLEDLLAMLERVRIARRTRRALAVKRRAGGKVGCDAPFGWMHHDGMRIENPDEQPILSRILSRHESGQTAYRIAKDLQAEGVPSRGGRWHTNTVRRILKRHGERTAS